MKKYINSLLAFSAISLVAAGSYAQEGGAAAQPEAAAAPAAEAPAPAAVKPAPAAPVAHAEAAKEEATIEADKGILRGGDGWMVALAISIGIGLAALAGAFGQARVGAAALEGIARNPNAADKLFVPMILGLAFIESLVLFTWVLMLLTQLKL